MSPSSARPHGARVLPSVLPFLLLVLVLPFAAGCGGGGGSSNPTQPPPPSAQPALTAFSAAPGNGQVTLQWKNPNEPLFASAMIRRKAGAAPANAGDGDLVYEGTDSSYVDDTVANGTVYHYAGWAKYAGGPTSDPVTAQARPLPPPPAPPTNVSATAQTHAVALSWTNPSSPDFDRVRIVRKTGGYPTGPNDGVAFYNANGTSTTNSGLSGGVTYYFSIYSVDVFGQFSAPAHASATALYEYSIITIPSWSATNLFPDHIAGDREFAGHGPFVLFRLSYDRLGSSVYSQLYFNAKETGGGDTEAEKTWIVTRATIPAGWTFDRWESEVWQQEGYTDTDHAADNYNYADPAPIASISIVGDTDGYDVGNTTSDDTRIVSISARSRQFRIRR